MNEIRTRILVGPDHRLAGTAPVALPPSEYEVTITLGTAALRKPAARRFDPEALPDHDVGPWPQGLSLRRGDLYDDDGR